ncbi:MAG: sigma-70 family RNA polymerase sigma factor [Gemmataceae bacterium]|nr:sigma-70 family RNA polymerase sigma factor [Gemmataceae bacterium]MCI0740113.1 sigma-70 family RNA polymerase sigma factor [Gemmataceae bacterium]
MNGHHDSPPRDSPPRIDTEAGSNLSALFEQARQGSAQAVQKLFETFEHALRPIIRIHMTDRMRPAFDSDDFMQDVRLKLLDRCLPREVYDSEESLFAYLVELAKNQVLETRRRYCVYRKHNFNREVPLENPKADAEQLPGRLDAAHDLAAAQESFERWQSKLPLAYRRVLVLLRDGYSQQETAAQMHISERTVRRLLKKCCPPPRPATHNRLKRACA